MAGVALVVVSTHGVLVDLIAVRCDRFISILVSCTPAPHMDLDHNQTPTPTPSGGEIPLHLLPSLNRDHPLVLFLKPFHRVKGGLQTGIIT